MERLIAFFPLVYVFSTNARCRCYGMVIFAGRDTKLMQNSGKTIFKRTSLDRLLNILILGIVFFLFSICTFCSVACSVWETVTGTLCHVSVKLCKRNETSTRETDINCQENCHETHMRPQLPLLGQYFRDFLPWDSIIVTDNPAGAAALIALLVFFSYTIVLNTVVPISLYVRLV